jgi:hypothetical protein
MNAIALIPIAIVVTVLLFAYCDAVENFKENDDD